MALNFLNLTSPDTELILLVPMPDLAQLVKLHLS